MYYGWSKEFLERGLAGDTARAAPGEVKDLRREAIALKEVVADLHPENRPANKRAGYGSRQTFPTTCGVRPMFMEIPWLGLRCA